MQNPSSRLAIAGALFMIVTGVLMGTMWSVFMLTGQVPEWATKPWSIGMHLAAKFTTAILLTITGLVTLRRARPPRSALVALGMLVYTVIQSPGYYLDLGQPPFVVMFAVLGIVAVYLAWKLAATPRVDTPGSRGGE